MIYITRTFTFSAAHRLKGNQYGCGRLHGHNYKASVTFVRPDGKLDSKGMIIDFNVVDDVVVNQIKKLWDHMTLVDATDAEAREVLSRLSVPHALLDGPPTVENMAGYLYDTLIPSLLEGANIENVKVSGVTIWETENSEASVG